MFLRCTSLFVNKFFLCVCVCVFKGAFDCLRRSQAVWTTFHPWTRIRCFSYYLVESTAYFQKWCVSHEINVEDSSSLIENKMDAAFDTTAS